MGLRERLEGKKRLPLPYLVRVDDTTEATSAATEAQQAFLAALGTEGEEAAREAVKAAQAALAACFEPIPLTPMEPEEFEALLAAHPAREGHPVDEAWNTDTLPEAAFLACAPDVMTGPEWLAWIKKTCSHAEKISLFNAAVAVNVRTISPTLPKDWMSILS
ncbi:hypothetical protein [Herbidospora daliensis]|uniref:hypothetical protein n=1 Tax=Herbidospora daliensis TaxID=295585 RepID=UPI0007823693|nr:hypothetical protein [Herbidospora daliensis]